MTKPNNVSAGFFIVRLLEPSEALGAGLLAPRVLTLSGCLTALFPDTSAIDWTSDTEAERVNASAELGIAADELPAVIGHMTAAFNANELGWPHVWISLESARAAARTYGISRDDFRLVELGVPPAQAEELIAELSPAPGEAPCGLLSCLEQRCTVHIEGTPLGWELLGVELGGSMHSWLCNSIHRDAHEQLGISPGHWGLIAKEEDAASVERLISSGIGAEPVPWFRGQLSTFDW